MASSVSAPTDGFGNVSGGGVVPRPLTLAEIAPVIQQAAGDIIRAVKLNVSDDIMRAIASGLTTELDKRPSVDPSAKLDELLTLSRKISSDLTTIIRYLNIG